MKMNFKLASNFNLAILVTILIISISICPCKSSSSLNISIVHATELLVNNLSKFHAEFPKGIVKIDEEEEEEEVFHFYAAGLDIKTQKKENPTAKNYFATDSSQEICEQLSNFSPYLVFKEDCINKLMHSFILEYFSEVRNLNDLKLFDAFEVVSINFIRKEFDDTMISDDMMFLILSFFHEMIYGIDETLPTSVDQWKIIFVQKLLVRDMPEAADYYMFLFNEKLIRKLRIITDERSSVLYDQVEKIITFFRSNSNCNKCNLLKYYDEFIQNNEDVSNYAPELKFAIKLLLHETLVPFNVKDMIQFFEDLITNFSFSQSFLDHFHCVSSYLNIEFKFKQSIKLKEVRMMKAIYKKLHLDSYQEYMKYLWTRDTLNPFDLNYFLDLNSNCNTKISIHSIIKFNNPGLVHLNIFNQLIQTTKYNFQVINRPQNSLQLELFSSWTSSIYLKIFLAQVSSPINMFVLLEKETVSTDRECWHIFNFDFVKIDHVKIFIENFKIYDDPLPLLFVNIDFLRQLQPLIVDKFNLKNYYKFDLILQSRNRFNLSNGSLLKLETCGLSFEKWKALQGKTLSFKKLIDFIGIEGLIDIFTTNPKGLDVNLENEIITPAISILKFFHQGILEPVNVNDEAINRKNCLIS